ncbi:MAG: hypothetical protein WCA84_11835 [Ignavibacteriaceae bacterium]
MEKIKDTAIQAHESLRHILFQLDHLRNDFINEMPKSSLGKELSEYFSELSKTAQAAVYDCSDFCFSLHECESIEDCKLIFHAIEV